MLLPLHGQRGRRPTPSAHREPATKNPPRGGLQIPLPRSSAVGVISLSADLGDSMPEKPISASQFSRQDRRGPTGYLRPQSDCMSIGSCRCHPRRGAAPQGPCDQRPSSLGRMRFLQGAREWPSASKIPSVDLSSRGAPSAVSATTSLSWEGSDHPTADFVAQRPVTKHKAELGHHCVPAGQRIKVRGQPRAETAAR